MNTIARELESLINDYLPQLNLLSQEDISYKPFPHKWSKKELIGHLIDSAHNNIRRFIVAQYEHNPVILYIQEEWVTINNYQEQDSKELIQLWYLINRQMCNILKKISKETAQCTCQTQEEHTVEWLSRDYIKHLKHHVHQVLELEPVAYP